MAMQAFPFELMGPGARTGTSPGFSFLFSVTLAARRAAVATGRTGETRDPAGARPFVGSLLLAYLGFTILCGVYFFMAPAVFPRRSPSALPSRSARREPADPVIRAMAERWGRIARIP